MEKVRCPSCKEWADWKGNPHRPFCGLECKSKDLGQWAMEKYRIPEEDRDSGIEPDPKERKDED